MKISNEDKKQLRRLGHKLSPVVTIASKGLSENVLAEIDRALNDHELIKVKLNNGDSASRSEIVNSIDRSSGSVYRPHSFIIKKVRRTKPQIIESSSII